MYTEKTTQDLTSIELNSTCISKNGKTLTRKLFLFPKAKNLWFLHLFISWIGEALYSNSEKVPNDSKGYKFLQISHSVGGNLQTISDFGGFDGLKDLQSEIDDVWAQFRIIFNSTFFQNNLWNPYTRLGLENDRSETMNWWFKCIVFNVLASKLNKQKCLKFW